MRKQAKKIGQAIWHFKNQEPPKVKNNWCDMTHLQDFISNKLNLYILSIFFLDSLLPGF